MKSFIKLFCLLIVSLPQFVSAQGFTFGFGADTLVFAAPNTFAIADGLVKNQIDSAVNYTWYIDSIDSPPDWNIYICDKNICYTPATLTEEFFLDPDEEGIFKLNVDVGSPGIGYVYMTIKRQDDSTQMIHQTVQINAALSDIDPLLEAGVTMSQNMPNPAVGSTMVEVDLKGRTGEIRLTDLTGRSIQTYQLSGQDRSVEIAADLPAGVYFYTLWMEGRPLISRKMQLK
ncbi:MAG: T9SS type A sorting domain-containing protein [Bacteroidota bacterium]